MSFSVEMHAHCFFCQFHINTMRSFRTCYWNKGAIKTELGRYMESHLLEDARRSGGALLVAFLKLIAAYIEPGVFNQADGALTQLQLATSPQQFVSGGFYHPIGRQMKSSHRDGENIKKQKELWRQTELAITTVIEKRRNSGVKR